MKNSASEVFCVDHSAAYQHAFGYIRQLAIHLRGSMKTKTKVRLMARISAWKSNVLMDGDEVGSVFAGV